MLIKFVEPHPRAGAVARMDSGRGQQLVDAGAAVVTTEEAENNSADAPQPSVKSVPAKTARQSRAPAAKK